MKPKIEWVNHSSFILDCGSVRLISDPWIEGTAFNDGWSLLIPTRMEYAAFSTINHIWFSHEHPDHFQPANLKKIPEQVRKQITVLFQKTADKKVLKFCAGLGFKCIELDPDQQYELGEGVRVRCQPIVDDSWLHVETADGSLLNLNDCVTNPDNLAHVLAIVGKVDILASQFSYAGWAGNPDDVETRGLEAKKSMDQFVEQVQCLKPEFTIPCASFVYFCHEENFHLNDQINKVDRAVAKLRELTSSTPVVLYPQDQWQLKSNHDNSQALAMYSADYASLATRPKVRSKSYTFNELEAEADRYIQKLSSQNNLNLLLPLRALRYLRPAKIHFTDADFNAEFGIFSGLRKSATPNEECDIYVSTDSFMFCLKFWWGHSTLSINGRFIETAKDSRKYFMRQFKIGFDNNFNRHVSIKYLSGLLLAKFQKAA